MSQAELNGELIAVVAGNVTVYNYDSVTREFISSSIEFLQEGVGIPANSCIDSPGKIKTGFTVCRTDDNKTWKDVVDHRGKTVYSIMTGEEMIITTPGSYPKGTTVQAPSTPFDKWDGERWVTDTQAQHVADVAEAEKLKSALLAEATGIIAPLADAQAGGYIEDADVPRMVEWQRYRYKLAKVNTSTAPEISLPQRPEV